MLVKLSERMNEYYRQKITLPPTIAKQGDAVANQAAAEGVNITRY